MKSVVTAFLFACLFCLTGCDYLLSEEGLLSTFSPAVEEAPLAAGYGPPPPKNYEEIIKIDFNKSFFTNMVIGTYDHVYTFEKPKKGATTQNRTFRLRNISGWVVCGTVDRKRRFGGYAGYEGALPFFVIFRDGKIAGKLLGQPVNNPYEVNRFNATVAETCAAPATDDK